MVKIVAGIDFDSYHLAIEMLKQLHFDAAEIHLLHSVEQALLDSSLKRLDPSHPLRIRLNQMKDEGLLELQKAAGILKDTNYSHEMVLRFGDVAKALIGYANEIHGDIIAVGSKSKGSIASLLYGSVTKALTSEAKQSILVVKQAPSDSQGLTALLATDHSSYNYSCIEKFYEWNIKGISKIIVLTAQNDQKLTGHSITEIEEKNKAICAQLEYHGIQSQSIVMECAPKAALSKIVSDVNIDLVMLGAAGHSMLHRFRLGSVSYQQVVNTHNNVLVIRL